jgi:hypothetical protein
MATGYSSGALPPLSPTERAALPFHLQALTPTAKDSFDRREEELDIIALQRAFLLEHKDDHTQST